MGWAAVAVGVVLLRLHWPLLRPPLQARGRGQGWVLQLRLQSAVAGPLARAAPPGPTWK